MPRLDLIGFVVADLDATRAFYSRLGLEIPEGVGHVELNVGALRVAFDTVDVIKSFNPEWSPAAGGHSHALAFLCDSPEEVDATHRALVEAGYRSAKEPWDAFWGQRYAEVLDPDGHLVDLFAPLT